jgi:membrane protein DedA with SNARE-associated domain
VLFGRLVPLVRSFVSIPAGVLEYPFGRYVVLTAIASLVWCLAFGIAGHALGSHWESLHHAFRYLDVAAVAVVAALLVVAMRRSRVAAP